MVYTLAGALLAGLMWMLIDAWRGYRVRAWLRHGDLAMAPNMSGWWGVLAERARKLLRERERSIDASEQRLKDFLSAIQTSPNGVVMLDAQAQIEWCNQTAAIQLGIHPERDVMQRIGNLMRDPVFTAYMALEQPTESVVLEGRGHRVERPVRISVQRHRYGEGKQLLLTRDVTMVEQAEAMRRDFVANVSHEIRTPLTVLSGFVETIQTLRLTQEEQKHYLSLMATQAHRMQGLVEDLLTLSRLEGSPVPGMNQVLPMSRLMQSCEQEAKGLSASLGQGGEVSHHIHFVMNPLLAEAELIGESRELQSALSNLVSNAVRYTPAGGDVHVSVDQGVDGSLSIEVRDTGAGIAAEHLPRLTERFYRVDRSRSRESGGTGLGLAIVKHVMQRHGGSLHISSQLGQGSCFKLVFPASRWVRMRA
ncbi:phosphate regulon sensor histidine kinase PhoR [Limnohabitans sp.]|jgi:two-component system phosphate regulon sensor histidine kinase PhoR|uniref:phosphate regulon sensor histidine kinase PhoR n=1 Tax=Limnohabitans sp. TaxID=1907725 RepID=UPI00286F0130|nr:phosphate regulon sensor histidine kinase PhoR [Limnohabitans sp.]